MPHADNSVFPSVTLSLRLLKVSTHNGEISAGFASISKPLATGTTLQDLTAHYGAIAWFNDSLRGNWWRHSIGGNARRRVQCRAHILSIWSGATTHLYLFVHLSRPFTESITTTNLKWIVFTLIRPESVAFNFPELLLSFICTNTKENVRP